VQLEAGRNVGLHLTHERVGVATGSGVQRHPNGKEHVVGLHKHGILDRRDGDGGGQRRGLESLDVAQAAARRLEIGLEQERHVA